MLSSISRRNPFVNQVSFFTEETLEVGEGQKKSQSLRKSGQFLWEWDKRYKKFHASRNPFVNQVSFFAIATL